MVSNVHERRVEMGSEAVMALLLDLASPEDRVWPSDRWPRMRLSNGVTVGSVGGHGFVKYSVEDVGPASIVFEFDETIGLRGTHRFELDARADGSCLVRHVLEGDCLGSMKILWPLVVRPLHDALIEDGLDNLAGVASGVAPRRVRLTRRVRLLRRAIVLTRTRPAPTPLSKRRVGDSVGVALVAIGLLHAAWGAGLTDWPARDRISLAERVVGVSRFPSATACYTVAGLLASASAIVTGRSRLAAPTSHAAALLGTRTVGSVLAVRGVGGLAVSLSGLLNETPSFRRANIRVYSPLCLLLAAGALWSTAGWSGRTSDAVADPSRGD